MSALSVNMKIGGVHDPYFSMLYFMAGSPVGANDNSSPNDKP